MNQFAVWLRRGLTTGLTTIAFVNSYSHTAQWFREQGQKKEAQWLALIPEAGVILVVLTLATAQMNRPLKWVIGAFGVGSLSLTLIANVSAAGPGFMGLLAALVAPVFAVLGFALEVLSLVHEPTPAGAEPVPVSQDEPARTVAHEPVSLLQPEPPVVQAPAHEPVRVSHPEPPKKAQRKPVSRPGTGLMDQGILWATAAHDVSGVWPSRGDIAAQFPDMSLSTVKRVRAAKPVGTDGTAKSEESVNA